MKNLFVRFVNDEFGATAVEYALLASLIAIAIIGGATTLGTTIGTKFGEIATSIN